MRPAGDPAEEWFGNEAFFLRRGDRVSTVTSGSAAVDFDPDVFADALVFLPGVCPTCRGRFCPHRIVPSKIVIAAPDFRARNTAPCGDGYRFAKHHGKPAIQKCGKSANGRAF
jgi:hypothetical protein